MATGPETTFVDAIAEAVVKKLRAEGIVSGGLAGEPRVLDVKRTAEYLARSESSIRELIATGKFPRNVVKKIGGRFVFVKAELDKWLEQTR